ncbi:hypothetical protein [Kitasatospora phosalacinea]|uniref:Uncharacterized protein n=1 Tax=Kitasatospora phosalacinea TaxID=2065 RepID=A0A9W6ULN4_9ACTN|nr:hypothetical protein [Kitasatospora phosalacinea]GLW54596.1 hypothetical protein Kpho01_26070 [Kitasatospora phosalacinea]
MSIAAPEATASATTPATASAAAPPAAPSVHVRALLTWLAVYPAITLAQVLLGPPLAGLAVPLRVLVLTALVVPTAVYLLVPGLLRARAALLRPRRRGPSAERVDGHPSGRGSQPRPAGPGR